MSKVRMEGVLRARVRVHTPMLDANGDVIFSNRPRSLNVGTVYCLTAEEAAERMSNLRNAFAEDRGSCAIPGQVYGRFTVDL